MKVKLCYPVILEEEKIIEISSEEWEELKTKDFYDKIEWVKTKTEKFEHPASRQIDQDMEAEYFDIVPIFLCAYCKRPLKEKLSLTGTEKKEIYFCDHQCLINWLSNNGPKKEEK